MLYYVEIFFDIKEDSCSFFAGIFVNDYVIDDVYELEGGRVMVSESKLLR